MVAQGGGNGQAGMLDRSDQAVAKTFLSRLSELDNHQAVNQRKCRGGHGTGNLLPKEKVLVTYNAEDCEEGRDGVYDCHRNDSNEDRLPPTRLEEVP